MAYQWDFQTPLRSIHALLWGVVGSIELAAASMLLAIVLGSIVATLRFSRLEPLSILARIYIDFFRSTAILVLIFWCYFALPVLVHLEIDPFRAALLAIGFQGAAYFAELARGAVQSIDRTQWEAAVALGLRKPYAFALVILPQAVRRMVPVTFSLGIIVFKNTSLAAAISFAELSYEASRVASETYRPIETYTIVALIYLVLITGGVAIASRLERRFGAAVYG